MSELVTFEGKMDKVIYDSPNFKIIGIKTDEHIDSLVYNKYGSVTVVGELPDLMQGISYKITGELSKHPKFGYQYKVHQVLRDADFTEDEVSDFLYAILTKRQADSLLSVYPDILKRIKNEEEIDLTKVKGIKATSFRKIKKKILDNIALMQIMNDFKEYALSMNQLQKLLDRYVSVEKLKQSLETNPYGCLCSIDGVGFITADKKILTAKPELASSELRLESCLMYCLEENESNGSTTMSIRDLYSKATELAPQCIESFLSVVQNSKELVFEGENICLKDMLTKETKISEFINNLLKNPKDITPEEIDELIPSLLTEEQRQGILNALMYNVSIICGYAGVGKSYTTKVLIDIFDRLGLTYTLVAPTGRASQVLSGYTRRKATTIHRALEYQPTIGFQKNADNKLTTDVLLIDEVSMVDTRLMFYLLSAIDTEKTRVIFIMDSEQLPSVSAGNIAHDLINSKKIPTTFLTKVFRYDEGGLAYVATQIRNGTPYVQYSNRQKIITYGINKDYSIINTPKEETLKYTVAILNQILQTNNLDDVIILSALNKGDYGSVAINNFIQNVINPLDDSKKELKKFETIYRVGDRVIQTKNNYRARLYDDFFDSDEEVAVFNGNLGTIKMVFPLEKKIVVEFEGNYLVEYNYDELDKLSLGYCISIHKSQGSSFKNIILVTPNTHKYFLTKQILYVGVTRAEERVFHITTPDVIHSALKNSEVLNRTTNLSKLLVG